MNQLSKSFSHYYKLLYSTPQLSFRSLRKSYITEMNMRYGDLANLITHGKGKDVVTNHYFDLDRILDEMYDEYLYKPKNLTPGSYTKAKQPLDEVAIVLVINVARGKLNPGPHDYES